MDLLPCGHGAELGPSRLCRHFLDAQAVEDGLDHVRLLTGRGVEFDICCPACDPRAAADAVPDLVEACEGCVDRAQRSGTFTAWRGSPQVLERPEATTFTRQATALPASLGAITDIAPLPGDPAPVWLLLTGDGSVARVDAVTGTTTILAAASLADEPYQEPWAGHARRRRLHVDPAGRFAAVVNDYGRHGQVIDLRTGDVTVHLDGGDYRQETVPFSVVLTEHAGRTVVVHRTAWNRLDVSDAATGEALTARTFEPATERERPPHYLDYFHGALHLSPDGQWLADDGWVWHPVGIPVVWSLDAWLTENVWESEDGATRLPLCLRDYFWDRPMCWTGPTHLAVSGIGDDEEVMLDGVRVYDVAAQRVVSTFAGPTGPLLAARGRLYSVTDGATHVWDPLTGERTAVLPDVTPTHVHPRTGELAMVADGQLVRWAVG